MSMQAQHQQCDFQKWPHSPLTQVAVGGLLPWGPSQQLGCISQEALVEVAPRQQQVVLDSTQVLHQPSLHHQQLPQPAGHLQSIAACVSITAWSMLALPQLGQFVASPDGCRTFQ